MTKSPPAVERALAAFPSLVIDLEDDRPEREIRHRLVGKYPVSLVTAPASIVEGNRRRSLNAGLDSYLKLIWQLGGQMRFEDAHRTVEINPGEMLLTSLGSDYRMQLSEGHEALIIVFDGTEDARWAGLVTDMLGMRVESRAGIAAAASGMTALLSRASGDRTAEIAARALIDLALLSAHEDEPVDPTLVSQAGLHIVRNIADAHYGPAALARDLGMSRRSLYGRLSALGTTPAALIRRIRLERARQDILQGDKRSILDIALANGFPDGAALSRAFRTAFGHTPSSLTAER